MDPDGRDRLLRLVAVFSPHDVRLVLALQGLKDVPIREGGDVVLQVLSASDVPSEVRALAAKVIASCVDRHLAKEALILARQEADPMVRQELWAVIPNVPLDVNLERLCDALREERLSDVEKACVLGAIIRGQRVRVESARHGWLGKLLADLLSAVLAGRLPTLAEAVFAGADLFPQECSATLAASVRQFIDSPERVPASSVRRPCLALGEMRAETQLPTLLDALRTSYE